VSRYVQIRQPPVQRVFLKVLLRQRAELGHLQKMHFLGIGKFILLMMVFPQVKTGMKILKGNVDKIKDIYHDDIGSSL
jgi:hypothetical protein